MTHSPAERRADKGIRLIVAATPEELRCEMASIGCLPAGIKIMTGKGRFHLFRLQQVPAAVANIIKQETLAHGAEAAVHWRAVSCGVAETDVLLMGTSAQLRQVCDHLQRQPFGLPGTARMIRELLDRQEGDTRPALRCGNHLLPLGEKTLLMGIINATPRLLFRRWPGFRYQRRATTSRTNDRGWR